MRYCVKIIPLNRKNTVIHSFLGNILNLNIQKGTPWFWQGRLKIKNQPILVKLVHKFNMILIKIAMGV